MSYLSSSEFVSPGHPDRLADVVAAKLIDKIQKNDGPNSHAAVEVFITRDTVIFGGEVTTTLEITDALLRECVVSAYDACGYIPEMRRYWTREQVGLAEDMVIINKLASQSPDIALGTTDKGENSGYNDQGVFFSSSEYTKSGMGLAMEVAALIGMKLFARSRRMIELHEDDMVLGPDNKVVVTVEVKDDGYSPFLKNCIKAITIAVAHNDYDIEEVRAYVKQMVIDTISSNYDYIAIADDCEWVINGTGKFVTHGASSDTSMTGRKISVNHPSAGPVWCNKMIGGGSLVKPWHASDFILNVFCRFVANVLVMSGVSEYAVVGCASAIGQSKPQSMFIKSDSKDNELFVQYFLDNYDMSPKGIADLFGFWDESFHYDEVVKNNFFGCPECQPWESEALIDEHCKKFCEWYSHQ